MTLADRIREQIIKLGRPATPAEVGPLVGVHPNSARTTANRAEWPKTPQGALWPPDLCPHLLTKAEAEIISAVRAGDASWMKLSPQEAKVVEALRIAA